MKKVLLLGAGLSTFHLVEYLAQIPDMQLTIADALLENAQKRAAPYSHIKAIQVGDIEQIEKAIEKTDAVISMLPPTLHVQIAKFCLKHQKHLLTASYLSEEMKALHQEAMSKNILFLNECGLDPGIDHLSAMAYIHDLQNRGETIVGFESYCGGLVAPLSDNNPWHYKITWNPRNVVVAGQGSMATYLQDGVVKLVPYGRLFQTVTPISIEDYGNFVAYPNRNSLQYAELYGLKNVKTLLRGTLRRPAFCAAWQELIEWGYTDDTTIIPNSENITYQQLFEQLQPNSALSPLYLEHWQYLGLLSAEKIGIEDATPAKVLQKAMQQNLKMQPQDQDMIVMVHRISTEKQTITAKLVVIGEGGERTAMSKTVGLPLAIATQLLVENKITLRGVQIPIQSELYQPILAELERYKIVFK
jgi:saccharopine dehydrogenase-like NADP-dependent oxidoreductase